MNNEFIKRWWKRIFQPSGTNSVRKRLLTIMSKLFLYLHPTNIRRASYKVTYTFCLGGLSFFLFLILIVSGIMLFFYELPFVTQPYQEIKDLQTIAFAGQFLRNVHRWVSYAMVIVVFLHMCRVFYHRAYRPPREFNWVVGLLLLIVTLLLSFSGYLIPWDQLSLEVGTNLAKTTPLLEPQALLSGSYQSNSNALFRFYILHIIALSPAAVALISLHFWRVRKDGFSGGL
ncbi:MAG: cytochrome b N-terminal domain-containing protein [Chloroflexota bacterium]|nr:cytochrome b N-terminal domain-containing protein [Chloroflexota bacterium]